VFFSENSRLSVSIISTPISSFSASRHCQLKKIKLYVYVYTVVPTLGDLPDGPLEPLAGRDDPQAERVRDDYGDGDGCIVKCLGVDGVKFGKTKHDRDERDPEHGGAGDCEREPTEMEWSAHETVRIEHAQRDRYPFFFLARQVWSLSVGESAARTGTGTHRRKCRVR
jgi:hypothetical protein